MDLRLGLGLVNIIIYLYFVDKKVLIAFSQTIMIRAFMNLLKSGWSFALQLSLIKY